MVRAGPRRPVERRLGDAAEAAEPGAGHDLADAGLAGLGAERQPDLLGQRARRAQQRRERVVGPPDRVEVVLDAVAGRRLDDHPGAVGRQRAADVAGRADRVAHVVQAVEHASPGRSRRRVVRWPGRPRSARGRPRRPRRPARGRSRSSRRGSRSRRRSRPGRPAPSGWSRRRARSRRRRRARRARAWRPRPRAPAATPRSGGRRSPGGRSARSPRGRRARGRASRRRRRCGRPR